MAITKGGMLIRTGVADIRETGRDSQGVIVIRLDDGDVVQDVAHVIGEKEDEALPEAGGLSTVDAVGEESSEPISGMTESDSAEPAQEGQEET